MPSDAPEAQAQSQPISQTQTQVTQLKIELVDSEPEIWRRVLVPAEITLSTLHEIVQRAMGWENLHAYTYQVGLGTDRRLHEPASQLSAVLSELAARSLYYTYDPACGWLHRITPESLSICFESASGPVRSQVLPTCLGGENACPPEGTEGVWGYDEFLARLENPEDPDYLTLLERYSDFNPDAFDLAAAIARVEQSPIRIVSAAQ